jgi:hypothetical protein
MRAKTNTFGLPMLPGLASLVAVATAVADAGTPTSSGETNYTGFILGPAGTVSAASYSTAAPSPNCRTRRRRDRPGWQSIGIAVT